MTRSTSKRCICGRSQNPPLCDGSHRSEGWSCAERDGRVVPFAFVASRSLSNLADRLAHRFEGTSLTSPQDTVRCKILVIIADGHDIEQLRKICGSVQAEQRLVMCVGVPPSVLAWAFPEASFLSLETESPALLWKSAEAQLMAEPEPASLQARPRVFLSHSVKDEAQLFPIVQALRGHFQIPLFVCADSIPTGSGWHDEIQKQLEQCDLFLFTASEAANRSVFCAFEAGMALALGKPIHVISLDGQSPPVHLQHLQAIDARRLQRRKPWLTQQDALLEASLTALNPGGYSGLGVSGPVGTAES
jgi:hypothetical protein